MHDGKQPPIEYSRLIAYDSKGNTVGKRQIASRCKAEVKKYTDSWMKNNPDIAIVEIEHVNDFPSGGIIFHATSERPKNLSLGDLLSTLHQMNGWIVSDNEDLRKELSEFFATHSNKDVVDAMMLGIPPWMLRAAITDKKP